MPLVVYLEILLLFCNFNTIMCFIILKAKTKFNFFILTSPTAEFLSYFLRFYNLI
jgi:hypothetical protein